MANYYTDRDNYFLQHASEIYEYLSGDSLSRYAHSSLLNYNNYDEVSLRIKEVTGYRKLKDSDVNIATISNSVASSLSSSHSSDIAVEDAIFYTIIENSIANSKLKESNSKSSKSK